MNAICKYTFLILLIFICALTSKAQITLENPSFESDGIGDNGIIPMYWHSCYQNNCGTFPDISLPYYFPPPIDGKFYGAIGSSPTFQTRRSLSTILTCPLIINKECSFSFYTCSYIDALPPSPYPEPYDVKGFIKVWLGNDSCVKSQLIYQSDVLDTSWLKIDVTFISNDNYQFIYFEAEKGEDIPDAVLSTLFIDAISPITVTVRNKAKIEASKVNNNCFNLQSTIDADIQVVRYEWKNKWGVISSQTSIENICIDKPTTIYFTAYDACGYSYTDSVILVKNNIISVLNENETELNIKIVKQPINSELVLYNAVGQLMYKQPIEVGISSIQVPIANWSKGVYFTTLQNSQNKEVNKWMKK